MAEEHPPRARRFLDADFRWRGTDVTRMEAIGDAVFALVLALLFLQTAPPANFREVKAALLSCLPFAITFTLLAMVWMEHYRFFRRYALIDKSTFFGNLLLLFLVLFYAYPLKFVFTLMCVQLFGSIGDLTTDSMCQGLGVLGGAALLMAYGAGFGAIYLIFALLYAHALRRAADLDLDVVERHMTVTSIVDCLVLVGFALTSIALAALSIALGVQQLVPIAGMVYFGIGPAMTVVGSRRGAAQRKLLAARPLAA
jgi:hypothetical protein